MTGPQDPWSDPGTATEPGAPYAGPPPTGPDPYGRPPYGQPHSGAPAWGPPPYGAYGAPWAPLPPRPPQRPGQVITAAVLAFVQSALVLIASLYLWMFASIADLAVSGAPQQYDRAQIDALAAEGTVLAAIQLVAAVLLVAGGVWGLHSRRPAAWRLLLAAHAAQVVLAVYWAVRLFALVDGAPGSGSGRAVGSLSMFFLAGPLTALGLLLTGAGRRWFVDRPAGA